jgi:alkanesulfonate monooxygenase SsuD/methylene tetrahydromethanopterin reductase-like flavin-dependent oxidoreductase (luciferase family)
MHANDARGRTDDEAIVLRRAGRWRVLARGAYCAVGDAEHVAAELLRLHHVGFDGLVLNFVDYLAELPYFASEVLPRLERAGVRSQR